MESYCYHYYALAPAAQQAASLATTPPAAAAAQDAASDEIIRSVGPSCWAGGPRLQVCPSCYGDRGPSALHPRSFSHCECVSVMMTTLRLLCRLYLQRQQQQQQQQQQRR